MKVFSFYKFPYLKILLMLCLLIAINETTAANKEIPPNSKFIEEAQKQKQQSQSQPPISSGICQQEKPSNTKFYIYKDSDSLVFDKEMPATSYGKSPISFAPGCTDCKPGFGNNGDSIRVVSNVYIEPFWAGFILTSKQDYWGKKPGNSLNLKGAKKLVVWAKSSSNNPKVAIQIKAAVNPKSVTLPYGDSAVLEITGNWEEINNQEWKMIEIPIDRNLNLCRVISLFALFVDKDHNSESMPVTFYIDEIYYEF